jgi:ribosome modulation factor
MNQDETPKIPDGATPAWTEGYKARLAGQERLDNPYLHAADEDEEQWDDGWLFAAGKIVRDAISEPEKLQGPTSER